MAWWFCRCALGSPVRVNFDVSCALLSAGSLSTAGLWRPQAGPAKRRCPFCYSAEDAPLAGGSVRFTANAQLCTAHPD
jgi:hypothetical protein